MMKQPKSIEEILQIISELKTEIEAVENHVRLESYRDENLNENFETLKKLRAPIGRVYNNLDAIADQLERQIEREEAKLEPLDESPASSPEPDEPHYDIPF